MARWVRVAGRDGPVRGRGRRGARYRCARCQARSVCSFGRQVGLVQAAFTIAEPRGHRPCRYGRRSVGRAATGRASGDRSGEQRPGRRGGRAAAGIRAVGRGGQGSGGPAGSRSVPRSSRGAARRPAVARSAASVGARPDERCVVGVPRGGSAAIDSKRSEPDRASRQRVDQGHEPSPIAREPARTNDAIEFACATRERSPQELAVRAGAFVDRIRGQREQGTRHPSRPPPALAGCGPGDPLVSLQLAVDRTKVVQLRLDLDHQDQAGLRVVAHDVDPASWSASSDGDLGRDIPACPFESSGGVGDTPRMGSVPLVLAVGQERCIHGQEHPRSQGLERPRGGPTCQLTGPAALDVRDRSLGRAGPSSELGLGPPDRAPEVPDRPPDCSWVQLDRRHGDVLRCGASLPLHGPLAAGASRLAHSARCRVVTAVADPGPPYRSGRCGAGSARVTCARRRPCGQASMHADCPSDRSGRYPVRRVAGCRGGGRSWASVSVRPMRGGVSTRDVRSAPTVWAGVHAR